MSQSIIRRSYNSNESHGYEYSRPVDMSEDYSLVLPDLRPQDSGLYTCLISAKVDYQNKEATVLLNVTGSLPPGTPAPIAPIAPIAPCSGPES